MRLYKADLADAEWTRLGGLLVTTPSRVAADLLEDGEDPGAVAHIVADAVRGAKGLPSDVARAIAPHAVRFGFADRYGQSFVEWLLDLAQNPQHLHPTHALGTTPGKAASFALDLPMSVP